MDLRLRSQLAGQRMALQVLRLLSDPVSEFAAERWRADPYPQLERMRQRGPLWRSLSGVWVATSYDVCSALLRDRRIGVRHADGRPPYSISMHKVPPPWMHTFLEMDAPDHTRLRRLATPAFARSKMPAYRSRIEALTDGLVDRMQGLGEFDLVREFAGPLPITVISELLGIPDSDNETFARYGRIVGASLDMEALGRVEEVQEVSIALRKLFADLIDERSKNPGDDVISTLAVALREDKLTPEELMTTAGLLLLAGFETTVNLLGNGVRLLLDHPEQWRALCADPTLAPQVVEEVLRFETPFQYGARFTHEPIEVDTGQGIVKVPADVEVMIMFGLANRDPEVFDLPGRFDIWRVPDQEHLAFANGAHYCLGAPLARLEGEIAFRTLATRLPSLRRTGPEVWRMSSLVRGVSALPVAA